MKIEHLALIISKLNGAMNPESDAYRLNNPGLLKSFSPRHEVEGGLRKFHSWSAGFKALIYDLIVKCSGKSRAHISNESSLADLLKLWEIKEPKPVVLHLRKALGDESISELTKVEYFNA